VRLQDVIVLPFASFKYTVARMDALEFSATTLSLQYAFEPENQSAGMTENVLLYLGETDSGVAALAVKDREKTVSKANARHKILFFI